MPSDDDTGGIDSNRVRGEASDCLPRAGQVYPREGHTADGEWYHQRSNPSRRRICLDESQPKGL